MVRAQALMIQNYKQTDSMSSMGGLGKDFKSPLLSFKEFCE